jgi:putative transposase
MASASRTVKRSKNRKPAIQRLAKGALKVSRQRQDFAVKAASALVTASDVIACEDRKIANLVKNHHLAKSISDARWGLFLSWVRYDGMLPDNPMVALWPRSSTQDCSGCGWRGQKTRSQRTHLCPHGGMVLDRDGNAALNILAAALEVGAPLRTAGQVATGSGEPDPIASGQTATTRGVRKSTSQTGWLKEASPAF